MSETDHGKLAIRNTEDDMVGHFLVDVVEPHVAVKQHRPRGPSR